MKQRRLAIVRQKYRIDGGAERFISRMLIALENKNFEFNILAREWKKEQLKNFNIHVCNPRRWSRVNYEKSFAKAVRALWKIQQFDIVQSHERISGCDIYRAGDGVHRRWIMQLSRILPKWRRMMLSYDNYHRYVMNSEREMYHASELKAVICNSKTVKQEIIDDFSIDAKKIHVIYNSVDFNKFFPSDFVHRTVLRQNLNIPLNATVFCFIGSGFKRKGLSSAIKAIKGTPVYLIVSGKDKAEKHYQSFAKSLGCQKQILFLGVQKETLPLYQLSDGLLLPSLYDPFPNVILEAMACGLPIITSNTCGGMEFIKQGQNGFFCDALNINLLREAIMSVPLLSRNNKMGTEARNRVKELTSEKLSFQLVSLYEKIFN